MDQQLGIQGGQESQIPIERIMGMCWVLTWKMDEDGTRKANARLVVKGFTDPDLATLRSESPTLSRLGKHWILQNAAPHTWKLYKGDV